MPEAHDPASRRWHTATVRWLYVFTALFGIVLTLLVGVISWVATGSIERDTDTILNWQLTYFGSVPDGQLAGVITHRLEYEHRHSNYYGLFDRAGRHIAGDIAVLPSYGVTGRTGVTLRHTLLLLDGVRSPIVRSMTDKRPDGRQLVVARDMTSVLQIREIVIRSLMAGGGIAVLLVIASSLVLGVRQIRRVYEMRRVTFCIAQGDLAQRLPVGGSSDELDMLAHLVNHMLDEIERLMGEVKGACDGIAHDLRTPLARLHTVLGRVAALDSVRTDEAGMALIECARTETDRLLERFRAMLRISEIGTLQRRGGFGFVDLAELVQELAELYEPLAESRALKWRAQIDEAAPIHGDRALLFEAFSNLIDNAIKFAPWGGSVSVALRATAPGAVVEIADNGPGIPDVERAAVLQRFYRGSAARQIPGSGLGLSMVSAVLRLHDFRLRIEDANDNANDCANDSANDSTESGVRISVECWPGALVVNEPGER
ncbi:MAG: HAMP domain-containing histidine kinase [Paraburkholderia sp.]|uniref:sensor histidine kinase n=1 Tax=Paraburkholderia sp. TaxID=1926495 RepID=UPI0012027D06|nr:HAMP domain-containing sensor histidine kinase [Paraburkholderia sp.]TAM08374.1 MAG: HAMP domain-containing histidine kinase [Paraburkholderia sp.]TAM29962.1 MAG: HAMP domain-containing histidine kinase [Paraburkholderia sp.]